MKLLKPFGHFWYDFIIGDDPKIAATVTLVLAILAALTATGALGDHALTIIGGVLLIAGFAATLALDVRAKKR